MNCNPGDISRRGFLAALAAMASTSTRAFSTQPTNTLPNPANSGIEHVVLVMTGKPLFRSFLGVPAQSQRTPSRA